ncbi:MAG: STAS domain-containing protein, partial [Actinomycetota bacterium]
MSDLASFVVDRHDDIVIGVLTGEVDLSNATELEGLITEAVPNNVVGVVLDLSGVTYIDSAGVRLLLSLAGRLRWRGGGGGGGGGGEEERRGRRDRMV